MGDQIIIYGCGGVGKELAECFLHSSEYQLAGFIDDNPSVRECMGLKSRTLEEFVRKENSPEYRVIISVGEPAIRRAISERLSNYGMKESIINLSDHFNPDYASVGEGTLLHEGSYISVDAAIGKCCMINKYAIVGHDCIIGDYSVLSTRVTLGGNVTVGKNTYIGSGALIRNGISIGSDVIVGMGAVVVGDVEDGVVVVGNPARILRKNESHRVFKSRE